MNTTFANLLVAGLALATSAFAGLAVEDQIRGVVVDHAGRPVAGARAYLAFRQQNAGNSKSTPLPGLQFPLDLDDGMTGHFPGNPTVTDSHGRFALPGMGTPGELVVVAGPLLQFWFAPVPKRGHDLRISLPEPATLIVRYDIPEDVPETKLRLALNTWQICPGYHIGSVQVPIVKNGGQIILTNLAPGTYDLTRSKALRAGTARGDWGRSPSYGRQAVTLQAGQTQLVAYVRTTGHPVKGTISGIEDGKAPGAYIYVRSDQATGGDEDWRLPLFDAVTSDAAGHFSTAKLEPGTYTFVAEAYAPRPKRSQGPKPRVEIEETGFRRADYTGTAKVTVKPNAPPEPVRIELRPRARVASAP